jgi:predicted SAM-dependent methyltransferase
MKLHIGSRARVEGWVSFDIRPGPEVDHVGDCHDLSRFGDGTVEAIYASHVLEHLSYRFELAPALTEWRRVLKPGGTAMISVPDFETLCGLFIYPKLNASERHFIMMMIFGGQTNPADFHKVGLNFEYLKSLLEEAGFADIRRVPSFDLFDDTSVFKFRNVPISLNVSAVKP